jgi:nitrite reductase/ring-hydroxylating ferredoxin subunit
MVSVNEYRVASASEITVDLPATATIDGIEVVIFRVGDQLHALENLCPHQHLAAFHRGHLDGSVVTCPMHGWSFDVITGNAVSGSGRLKTFGLRVENGTVIVAVPPQRHDRSSVNW